MSDITPDPAMATAVEWAKRYADACGAVLDATNACIEIANQAVGARNMANQRPQHEISIRNFTTMAVQSEAEFVPQYRAFVAACSTARDAAASFLGAQSGRDPELVLMTCVEDDAYGRTGVAVHILRTNFGPTPAGFIASLQEVNEAIQGDVFVWGEDGFQGNIYVAPAPKVSDERTCPWCAETIKAAAIICRFCGREVQAQTNPLPS